MIDILKRIFIGVAISMSIFFIKSHCFALSYDLHYESSVTVYDNNSLSFNTQLAPDVVKSLNFNTNYSSGNDDYLFVMSYSSGVYSVNSVNGSGTYAAFYLSDITYRINLMSTSGSWEQCETQNNYIVCPTHPNKTYTGLRFYFTSYPVGNLSSNNIYVRLNTNAMLFSSNSQTTANNSSETLNETKKITDTTDNSGNGNSYDNSGVTSNNSKEESLTDGADDLFDNFDVDLSSNTNAFQFIFQLLTRFVQANAKIFGVILSILSFGFIKLVLGR